jgi:hypothetical protein
MSDFSQQGSDGEVPFSMSEWRRGAVYTVRPEILSPLVRGQEYRSGADLLQTKSWTTMRICTRGPRRSPLAEEPQ